MVTCVIICVPSVSLIGQLFKIGHYGELFTLQMLGFQQMFSARNEMFYLFTGSDGLLQI